MPSKKRSWRDDPTPRASTPGKARTWQKDPTAGDGSSSASGFSRRTKILFVGGTLLIGIVITLIVLLWPEDPKTPYIALIGAGYETNLALPHNAHGQNGLQDLHDWTVAYNDRYHPEDGESNGIKSFKQDLRREEDAISNAIEDWKENGDNRNFVLFLSLHGGADQSGGFLFPDDASPGRAFSENPDNVLHRLDRVFGALQQLPEKTKKLLILDATQVRTSWSMGMISNTFAEALEKNSQRQNIQNLVVLSSSAPNQRSWVSYEYGRSIFAHFVIEGLKGAADKTEEEGANDARITTLELVKFVQDKVEHWSRHNRGAIQTPVMLGEEDVAGGMELVAAIGTYEEPNPRNYKEPDGLLSVWKERFDLEKAVPAPYVYSPHLWRRYQEALIRYEELLLADSPSAADMKKTVETLRSNIVRAQTLQKDLLGCSLALPEALHRSLDLEIKRELGAKFAELWDDPKKSTNDFESDLINPVPSEKKRLARLFVTQLLLEKLDTGDEAAFERVCSILPVLDDVLSPRPIEAHYALQLRRGLYDLNMPAEARPEWTLSKKSLQVLARAERTALGLNGPSFARGSNSYSEQLMPWLHETVNAADRQRRLGQDLLFAGGDSSTEANRLIDEADAAYKPLIDKMVRLRSAFATRDRVLANLPFYTTWHSTKMLNEDENQHAEALLKQKVGLWKKTHELSELLDTPDPEKIEDIEMLSKDVEIELEGLASQFQDRVTVKQRPIIQRQWHELQGLLDVPFIDPTIRLNLLAELHTIGQSLHKGTDKATEAGGMGPKVNQQLTEAAAKRQAALAVAVLGHDSEAARNVAGLTWTSETVGTEIGEGFRRIAAEASDSTTTAKKQSPKQGLDSLRKATRQTRLLDGGLSAAWLSVDPVEEKRRVELHELFLWQAERTFQDYWADEAGGKAFYQRTGDVYLGTAIALLSGEGRTAQATELQTKINAPSTIAIHWKKGTNYLPKTGTLHLTDEPTIRRSFGLKGAADTPEGTPVVWSEVGSGLSFEAYEPSTRRTLSKVSAEEKDSDFHYDLLLTEKTNRAKKESKHVVHCYFRGRHEELPTPVRIHYQPDLVSYQPEPPSSASFAAIASDELIRRAAAHNTHLIIVLDCSGTMRGARYQKVLKALDTALRKLPAGVTLSVYTFGAGRKDDNERAPTGENVVKQRRNRIKWEATGEQREELMEELRELYPKWYTPLVYAMYRAGKEFEKSDKSVAKSLLVLTDGVDQGDADGNPHFPTNPENFHRQNETVGQFLQRYFPQQSEDEDRPRYGVLVNVLGVEVDTTKAKQKALNEQFIQAIKGIDGNYIDVADTALLDQKLDDALFKLRFFIYKRRGQKITANSSGEGNDVTAPNDDPKPVSGLEPGQYMVALKLFKAHQGLNQFFSVERGDTLFLQLADLQENKGVFRRALLKDLKKLYNNGPLPEKSLPQGWHVSVDQNMMVADRTTNSGLQMMMTIDNDPNHGEVEATEAPHLELPRPGMAWFRVRARATPEAEPTPVSGLRISPLYFYPAAAWSLDFRRWPSGQTPVVEAFWSEIKETGAKTPGIAKILSRDRDFFTSPAELQGKEFPIRMPGSEPTPVTVESIRALRQEVEVTPGNIREEACLVVRLSYPEGAEPFFVQLPERLGSDMGYEHRFYQEAGKYTGVFWPIDEIEARNLEHLHLISLEMFRQNSRKATFTDLGVPNRNSRRPHTIGEEK